MRKRVITAVVALAVLTPFVVFSGTFMLEIFTIVLSVVSVYEMLHCIGFSHKFEICAPAYLTAFVVPLLTRRVDSEAFLEVLLFIFFALMFYYLALAVFSSRKLSTQNTSLVYVTTVYIVFSFNSIILLRDLNHGQYIFLLVFLCSWLTDTGAYVIGVLFGKHKLIKDVSPKKTIEGAIGGVFFGVLSFVVFGFTIGLMSDVTPRYVPLIIVGIIMSIISQCGDLIASLIKREYNIKDYGYIFPGHGGVLDRFDSIIATAPFLYILCSASSYFELFF